MEYIINHWQDLVGIITGLVTAASIIVKLTPSKNDDEAMGMIMKILNLVALNPKK